MSRIVDIEPLLKKYDGMNEGTEFSPIHFINDLMSLEQQPSEDAVSREAVEEITFQEPSYTDPYNILTEVREKVRALPPVTPTNEDIKEAYLKGYDYGVKDWFKSKTQPSEDCVSREHAKQFLYERIDRLNDDELYDIFSRIIDDMYNELPSVTLERPKGKWNFIGDQMFECSSCKRTYTQNQFEELRIYTTDDLLLKFCPNCGAYMREGEEE